MAATQHLHYASNHQPSVLIDALLRQPEAVALLRRFSGKSFTLPELALSEREVALLRRLRHVNLITSYEIGGVVRYRAHRFPPAVTLALAA